jgi:hypothetical protein
MLSNRFAFAALGVACIGAAAGGGYIATRQNSVPTPAAAQSREAAAAPATPATPSRPVQETEAVVPDAAARPASAAPAMKTATPAPAAKRVEPVAHPAAARATRTVARQEAAAPLQGGWPGNPSAQQPPAPVAPPPADLPPPAPRDDRADRAAQEPPRAPEPPQKMFEELVVPTGSVIGLQTETRLTSETAHVEDRVEARVTRDVRFGDRVAIPAGTRVIGSVMQVERGGKFKEAGKLGIRFNTLVLADGTRVAISTETIIRSGDAPGNSSAAKVGGGAVVGTILGALMGGSKGAAIGGAAGAGAGAGAVSAGDRSVATLPAGTPMTVRILSPITITTEK